MLYLFWGEDTYRSRQKFREFIEKISGGKNRPFSFSWLTSETFEKSFFEELLRLKNLFEDRGIIVCESLLKDSGEADFLKENLPLCGRSENIFIFWEENVEPTCLEQFREYAEKVEQFKFLSLNQARAWLESELEKRKVSVPAGLREEMIKQAGGNLWSLSQELEKYALTSKTDSLSKTNERQINVFQITDAISQKSRGQAWLLFQKAVMAGMDPEEIFWKIVWHIKNLLIIKRLALVSEREIAEKTRMHPFVVKKAVSASRGFTEEKLAKCSSELINIYHNSRRGLTDFETGIEKFLIKL